MTDTDILSGIHEAAHTVPEWAATTLESACPPAGPVASAFEQHFGVVFADGELEAATTIPALIELLRVKFREG
jgi:hypothetical protein